MPARDLFHNNVKNALIKDGWTITHDPLHLKWGFKDMYVDLGAQQLLAAEKSGRKIGIEIKSFVGYSEMNNLEHAIGQYILYNDVLEKIEPDRNLYLAISKEVFNNLFEEPIGKLLIENHHIKLIIFEPNQEVILQWIE